ncbi:MAG: hypothetical protein Q8P81_00585 [Nanoarchaeota archaeon]|nr:hypothetical protein [Nanoarchaeota archaeon]
MKWFGISGSWRYEFPQLETDVAETVLNLVSEDGGIITGGALGVDSMATQSAMTFLDPKKFSERLRVYLPVSLDNYLAYLRKRAHEGATDISRVDRLEDQLRTIENISPRCIMDDWGFTKVDKESYYFRIAMITRDIDELYVFHVNGSEGVQHSMDVARNLGKPIHLRNYVYDL